MPNSSKTKVSKKIGVPHVAGMKKNQQREKFAKDMLQPTQDPHKFKQAYGSLPDGLELPDPGFSGKYNFSSNAYKEGITRILENERLKLQRVKGASQGS